MSDTVSSTMFLQVLKNLTMSRFQRDTTELFTPKNALFTILTFQFTLICVSELKLTKILWLTEASENRNLKKRQETTDNSEKWFHSHSINISTFTREH